MRKKKNGRLLISDLNLTTEPHAAYCFSPHGYKRNRTSTQPLEILHNPHQEFLLYSIGLM